MKNKLILIALGLLLFAVGLIVGNHTKTKNHNAERIDTITSIDTIYVPNVIEYRSTPTPSNRTVTTITNTHEQRRVSLPDTMSEQPTEINQHVQDDTLFHIHYSDTIQSNGNDSLIAEYNAHITSRDSTTTLDSLIFRTLTSKKIVETQTITKTKTKKWNVGATVGAGYGIVNKTPDIFIGVGLTYRIW